MNIFTKIAQLKKEGKVVGFTASTFDLMHPGHITMLQGVKTHCDFLIVGLLTDPTRDRSNKNYPIQTSLERWIQLQAIDGVDFIIPFDTEEDLENMIKILGPDVREVGDEYKGKKHTGWDIEGTEIIYNKREHTWSSTELRDRIYEQEKSKSK